LIEAKMMRMKGHAIHDAAQYVPRELFEYWRRRDPLARFQDYLLHVQGWLTEEESQALIAQVEQQIEADRDFALSSPMPDPATVQTGVYCDGSCHQIKPKYAMPITPRPQPPASSVKDEPEAKDAEAAAQPK
jgi:TPP-dependent pyruvate/acetoin dehydrogenase alpha subunit